MSHDSLPDGPRSPALAQTLQWLYRPIELMTACRRRYGEAFSLRFAGFPPAVVLSDPAAIKDVFTGDPAKLHAGPANNILRPTLGGGSLLLLDGKRHHDERKLMMPSFHGERMHAYGEAMRAIADDAIGDLIERGPVGEPFALHPVMQHITLEVILRTVFGMDEGSRKEALADGLRRLLAFGERPSLLLLIDKDGQVRARALQERMGRFAPWAAFQRTLDRVNGLLDDEIRRRRAASAQGQDVLSMFLAARDEQGRGLDDDALRDEMKTLLVAGHETTATALTWAVLCLLEHPHVRARLSDELAAGKEEYLDAVVKESLRRHPIVPMVGRYLTEPVTVGGRTYPAGVALIPSIYLTHHRQDTWPEPERFLPERFLGKKPSPYEFFPFGGGVRRCIGMAFAMFEMRVVLREIVQRTRLELAPGYRPKLVRRGVTFAPAKGLLVRRTSAS